jgi:hypothetical protein
VAHYDTGSSEISHSHQCTGTCASEKKCVATKTVIHEQVSSNNATRLADIYCGCMHKLLSYSICGNNYIGRYIVVAQTLQRRKKFRSSQQQAR